MGRIAEQCQLAIIGGTDPSSRHLTETRRVDRLTRAETTPCIAPKLVQFWRCKRRNALPEQDKVGLPHAIAKAPAAGFQFIIVKTGSRGKFDC